LAESRQFLPTGAGESRGIDPLDPDQAQIPLLKGFQDDFRPLIGAQRRRQIGNHRLIRKETGGFLPLLIKRRKPIRQRQAGREDKRHETASSYGDRGHGERFFRHSKGLAGMTVLCQRGGETRKKTEMENGNLM
jgi:hypothetical protein